MRQVTARFPERRCGYNARVNSALTPFAQLHAALQSGEITPVAAAEQHLARANSNSGHNVYIAIDRERALRDADEVTRRFAGRAKPAAVRRARFAERLFRPRGICDDGGDASFMRSTMRRLAKIRRWLRD